MNANPKDFKAAKEALMYLLDAAIARKDDEGAKVYAKFYIRMQSIELVGRSAF